MDNLYNKNMTNSFRRNLTSNVFKSSQSPTSYSSSSTTITSLKSLSRTSASAKSAERDFELVFNAQMWSLYPPIKSYVKICQKEAFEFSLGIAIANEQYSLLALALNDCQVFQQKSTEKLTDRRKILTVEELWEPTFS